ncbi:hypothetical protein HG530_001142 [Fusarium avenaceum]|nr:hypothetical protein HG530_001142 [Fusarium avenaceum]
MSDPKVAQAIADGRVPKGITADYLNETKDTPAIAGIIFITCLTSIIVLGRLASRALLIRRFGFDDALTLLSWIFLVVFVGLCIKLIQLGSGRHFEYIQYVLDMPTIEDTEVLDFVAHIIYTTTLLFCRMSDRIRHSYRWILTAAIAHSVPLHANYWALAVRVAAWICELYVLTMGIGLQRQFLGVAYLRPVVVRDSDCHASGIGDAAEEKDSAGLYSTAGCFVSFAHIGEFVVANGVSVIAISITRLVFVIEGQWNADQSWAYNPMLAIEVSEIGATLIALSVPGVKPLFDKFILRRDVTQGESTGKSRYGQQASSKGGTALRSLNFRPEHDVLTSRDTSAEGMKPYRTNVTRDNQSENSADGILVQVDFRLKEDTQDARTGSSAGRSWK